MTEYEAMVSPGRTALAPANIRVMKKKGSALSKPAFIKPKMKDPRAAKASKVLKAKVGLSY